MWETSQLAAGTNMDSQVQQEAGKWQDSDVQVGQVSVLRLWKKDSLNVRPLHPPMTSSASA